MSLTSQDVAFVHAVADKMESQVIANCTQGRWRAGAGVDQATASTMRACTEDGSTEYLIGTAIDKRNQRALVGAQPEVLRANVTVLRAISELSPDELAIAVLELATAYNRVMSLKVPEPSPVH